MGEHRIPNLILCLLFDKFLPEFETTYLVTPCEVEPLKRLLDSYNLDPSRLEFVSDREIEAAYPDIRHWRLAGDPRPSWLAQQAIKLAMLDRCNTKHILIQDIDSFCLGFYQPFVDHKLNFFFQHRLDQDHSSGYYEAYTNATGLTIGHNLSFCCDILPVDRDVFEKFKQHIESHTGMPWLQALIESTPFTNEEIGMIKWFSEYETLANWHISQTNDYMLTEQHRAEFQDPWNPGPRPRQVNFASDKDVAGGAMRVDWRRGRVQGMDEVINWLGFDKIFDGTTGTYKLQQQQHY
jgi:hypothetical protein